MKVFDLSPKDQTNKLAKQIGMIGLERIDCLLKRAQSTFEPYMILCPDASPSRNAYRCSSGFITGAKYVWGDGSSEVLPIGFNANGCGFCIYGLNKLPDPRQIIEKLEMIKKAPVTIDGTVVEIDLNKSNHFFGIFEVREIDNSDRYPYKYISLMHCSAPEFKKTSKFGFGLDYNQSEILRQKVEVVNTSRGDLHCATGKFASLYYAAYKHSEWYACEKRKRLTELILNEAEYIDDRMHLGYDTMNSCILGNQIPSGDSVLVPFLTGPNSSSYFVKPSARLSEKMVEKICGIEVENSTVASQLANTQILPHSAGYNMDYLSDSDCYVDQRGLIQIAIETTMGNKMFLRNISDTPYSYKGDEVLDWSQEHNFITRTHRLEPNICVRF